MNFSKLFKNDFIITVQNNSLLLAKQKVLFLAALLCCITFNASGGKLEKGFERLKIFDYFNAKYYFEKSLKTQTSGAAYGLSIIFSLNNNPFYNLDSARVYVMLADSTFKISKPKTVTSYQALGINKKSLKAQKDSICDKALKSASIFSTLETFNEYIKKFSFCDQVTDAVTLRNTVAFDEAKKANTAASYKLFIESYPTAKEFAEAKNRYQDRLYEEATSDKKITSYKNFIQQQPESPYRMQAEDAIYRLAVPQKTIEQYDDFIKNNPDNKNINDGWHQLYNLFIKNYNPQDYEKFNASYPNYPFKNELEADYRLQLSYLLPYEKDSLWGFINEEGKVIIKPVYDEVSLFSDGLALAVKNSKVGFINKVGKEIIPLIYEDAEPFKNNTAVVSLKQKYGLINNDGKEQIAIIYEELSEPSDNICLAVLNDKSGYVTINGKKISDFLFDFASDFKFGFAIVSIDDQYGLINVNGSFAVEIKYDELTYFSSNLLKAKLNGKVGLINFSGDIILPFEYDVISEQHNNRALIVQYKKFGFIDGKGKIVIPISLPYNDILNNDAQFINGYVLLNQKNKTMVLDSNGHKFSINGYDENRRPSDSLIAVKKNKKWGYVDVKDQLKIALKFDFAGDFENNIAIVKTNKAFGAIDNNGKIIVPEIYNGIYLKNNYLLVNANGKAGLFNPKGNKLLDIIYDHIDFLTDKIASATNDNHLTYINLNTGKVIWSNDN